MNQTCLICWLCTCRGICIDYFPLSRYVEINVAQRSRKKCEKIRPGEKVHGGGPSRSLQPHPPPLLLLLLLLQSLSAMAVNPSRTGGATAPPSCRGDEIRKQLGGAAVSSRFVTQKEREKKRKKKSLPTLAITSLQANMSSLHSNFSNADVPSGAFFFLLFSLFYKRHQ